jgi:WhiB family redox-sensing transcriptional regulator
VARKPIKHGTRSGYVRGCRCDECSQARRDYENKRNAEMRVGARPRPVAQHGSRSKYRYGCRCEDCTEANRAYNRNWLDIGGVRENEQRLIHFLDALRPDWVDKAACKGMTALFFPEKNEAPTADWARRICNTCPVQAECREYGMQERFGIWGGLSEMQRRPLRKEKRERFVKDQCGTVAGYQAHRRKNEEACRVCKDALAAYHSGRRAEQGGEAS